MELNEVKANHGGSTGSRRESPLFALSDDDLALVVDLVLESGSLKGLAKVYSVSYPTIRGRLDKLIERLKTIIEGKPPDPLREYLADLIRRGVMNIDTARRIAELAETNGQQQEGDSP